MLFIEVLRLILVLVGALGGLEVGHSVDAVSPGPVTGLVLGALVGYVVGGLLGRYIARQQGRALRRLAPVPPGELFAGTLTGIAGLILGVVLCLPLVAVLHSSLAYSIAAAVGWIGGWSGYRVGEAKGRQVVAAAGLSRILAPPTEPPPGYAMLLDTSAVMDRSVLVLGEAGMFVGGLVVPRFVLDEVHAQAAGPDPAASRRARRGLEAIEVLRECGIPVHVAPDELPQIEDPDLRLLELSRRLGLRLATCSARVHDEAVRRGLAVTNLRLMAEKLEPEVLPGQGLVVDLEREGNQPRQAVGYLPDGNMVVVNDASHLIGRSTVAVEVLTTRKTSQGLLVFARLADD
ncbi:MAG: glycine zipper domain-containing protein [Actinomycetota bacterium]|nr:glycine zipper domain-containing protein [Actinomycetota bacterium]